MCGLSWPGVSWSTGGNGLTIPQQIDLHLHTLHSDGRWRPSEVVEEAARRGLVAISVTDHDVLAGLPEAFTAADQAGIEIIPGVELTADWGGKLCHILGYGIDPENEQLNTALSLGKHRMGLHVGQVLKSIREAGHDLTERDLERYNTRYATGASLVLAMLERGILRRPEARKLLVMASREPRAYTAVEAIDLIHGAGGVAVLAHPARLRKGDPLLPALVLGPLVASGLDGIEIWHGLHPQATREHYQKVASEFGLIVTGGSDCHGPRSTGIRMGSQSVPYRVLTELRERLAVRASVARST